MIISLFLQKIIKIWVKESGFMKLSECLKIEKGVTAVIGGGGKTTMTHVLARELAPRGKVIITTTTKIWPPQEMICLVDPAQNAIVAALEKEDVICVGNPHETGKLTASSIPISRLAELCDYLLVEADGSAGLPLKGHNENEPQIPPESNQIILVLGVWGIGQSVERAAHRPAIYARLAGAEMDDIVTAEMAAKVISAENLHTKVFINGVEDEEKENAAHAIAAQLNCPVVAGALQEGKYQCLF